MAVDRVASLSHTDQHVERLLDRLRPQGAMALIDDPDPAAINLLSLRRKSLSLHLEWMFTRSHFQTADMARQGEILRRVAELADRGHLRSTARQCLGPISASSVRLAHRQVEAGLNLGKRCSAASVDGGGVVEQTVEVMAHHGAILAALLEQKTGQGSLHQPVLIPFGVPADELAHRVKKILRELVFNTDGEGGVIGDIAHASGMSGGQTITPRNTPARQRSGPIPLLMRLISGRCPRRPFGGCCP